MRWVDRFDAGVSRAVDGARKRSAAFDHAWQAISRFVDVDANRLAAAISYYAFFAAFSLAVFVYALLGRLLGSAQTGVLAAINSYLEGNLPWVADTTRQVGQGQVTVVAGAVLLLSGIGWVENLRSSLRAVWLIEQHPGNWLLRRLVNLGMLVGLGVLLGLSLATTGAVDRLLAWLAPDTTVGEVVLRLFGPVLEFVVNLVLAAALLTAVPRLRLSPRRLALPAVVIAAGIQLLNTLGRLFIARTEGQPAYRLVAGAAGLLVYLYLLNQVILLGAALAATSTAGTATDLARGVASGLPGAETTAGIGVDDPQDHVGEPRPPRPDERR